MDSIMKDQSFREMIKSCEFLKGIEKDAYA